MASSSWIDASSTGTSIDFDTESSVSLEEHSAKVMRILARLLREGWAPTQIAKLAEIDLEEVERVQSEMAAELGGMPSFTVDIPGLVERLLACPAEYLCPITKKIMHDPVTDSQGTAYDRTAIEEHIKQSTVSPVTGEPIDLTLHPVPTLRVLVEKFKVERMHEISEHVPALMSLQQPLLAARILAHAEEMGRSIHTDNGRRLLQQVLELYVQLPTDGSKKLLDLVRLMLACGCFAELVRRFEDLHVADILEELSCASVRALYTEAKELAGASSGEQGRDALLTLGHALHKHLLAIAMQSTERKQLLMEMHEASPEDENICTLLSEYMIVCEPEGSLKAAVASLPTPVVKVLVAHAENGISPGRAASIFLGAGGRAGLPSLLCTYRRALQADPTCVEAGERLVELLSERASEGTITVSEKEELACLLVAYGNNELLVHHFDLLHESLNYDSMDVGPVQLLLKTLVEAGSADFGAIVAVVAAEKLELLGSNTEAFHHYAQAFNLDNGNRAAESSLWRLSVAFGFEWEAGSQLLASLIGAGSTEAADRAVLVRELLQLHDRKMKGDKAMLEGKVATLEKECEELHHLRELHDCKVAALENKCKHLSHPSRAVQALMACAWRDTLRIGLPADEVLSTLGVTVPPNSNEARCTWIFDGVSKARDAKREVTLYSQELCFADALDQQHRYSFKLGLKFVPGLLWFTQCWVCFAPQAGPNPTVCQWPITRRIRVRLLSPDERKHASFVLDPEHRASRAPPRVVSTAFLHMHKCLQKLDDFLLDGDLMAMQAELLF